MSAENKSENKPENKSDTEEKKTPNMDSVKFVTDKYISLKNSNTEVIPYVFTGKIDKVDITIPAHRVASGKSYLLLIMNRVVCNNFKVTGSVSKHYSASVNTKDVLSEGESKLTSTEIIDELNSIVAQGESETTAAAIVNNNITGDMNIKMSNKEFFDGSKNYVILIGKNNVSGELDIDITYQPLLVPLPLEHKKWLLIGTGTVIVLALIALALWYVYRPVKKVPRYGAKYRVHHPGHMSSHTPSHHMPLPHPVHYMHPHSTTGYYSH